MKGGKFTFAEFKNTCQVLAKEAISNSRKVVNHMQLKHWRIEPTRLTIWKAKEIDQRFWKFSSDMAIKGKSTIKGSLIQARLDDPNVIRTYLQKSDEEKSEKLEKNAQIQLPSISNPETIDSIVLDVSGNLSLEIGEGSHVDVKRSGYAAALTKKFFPFVDGTQYDTIEMIVKTDGRGYIANLSVYRDYDDILFQSIFTTEPDKWSVVKIPLDNFIMSWEGFANKNQIGLFKQNIQQFGILMAERKEGPYSFQLASVSLISEATLKSNKNVRFTGDLEYGY